LAAFAVARAAGKPAAEIKVGEVLLDHGRGVALDLFPRKNEAIAAGFQLSPLR
jgi:hypothetical protein